MKIHGVPWWSRRCEGDGEDADAPLLYCINRYLPFLYCINRYFSKKAGTARSHLASLLWICWHTTLCPQKTPPPAHVQISSKLASFAQLQFNSMNICLFSIKLPILEKISPSVIEILTFNEWSSKVYRFQKCAFLLTLHGVDSNISIDTFVTLAKKQTKMVFSTEDLLVMVALCNRATIIFSSCFFFFLLFFPRLISAVWDWMFTILWHMVWP